MASIKNLGTATMRFGEGAIVTGSYSDDDTSLIVSGSIKIGLGSKDFTLPLKDGSQDQVLATDGDGNVDWVNPGKDYSVFAVDCNAGDVTATLPAPSSENEGLQVTFIKNAGGNTLTITAGNLNIYNRSSQITNYSITGHMKNVTLICLSYTWVIIAAQN